MLQTERKKLIELTSRAVDINKILLNEEKKFMQATSEDADPELLKKINEEIRLLVRKEVLYIGATEMYLKKICAE